MTEERRHKSPQDMRAEMAHMSRSDPLIQRVTQLADHGGWCAEDRYTILAYHALKERDELTEQLLQMEKRHTPRTE